MAKSEKMMDKSEGGTAKTIEPEAEINRKEFQEKITVLFLFYLYFKLSICFALQASIFRRNYLPFLLCDCTMDNKAVTSIQPNQPVF